MSEATENTRLKSITKKQQHKFNETFFIIIFCVFFSFFFGLFDELRD